MPGMLHDSPEMPQTTYAPNGARLVSLTGEALPLKGITLTGTAVGGIARIRLHQRFTNPYPMPLELTYAFPLPADGAVAGYEIRAGNRLIKGRIERRDDALTQYEAARLEGRTAALVEQERPNLFTQRLGNIPASTDVTVELTIDHPVAWLAGSGWEWRFPTVVAPRYLGTNGTVPDADAVTMDVVNGVSGPRASVELTIDDPLVAPPTSTTHSIAEANGKVTLVSDAVLDRDIVIRWATPRQAPALTLRRVQSAATDARAGDSAYGLLTIVPPIASGEDLARDLVLLLDVSGSMDGRPLEHLKAVVTTLIDSLDDDDRLEMVAFSSEQVRYRSEPVHATEAERRKACAWIGGLRANGGTELISAIDEALRPLRAGVPRQVVVVTDGLIGFEAAAVRSIRDGLPPGSRLHTMGVGSASNRSFLRPAARAGRGVEVLIDLDEAAGRGAERIAAATREPVVVDVVLQGSALLDAAPRLPDLLTGSPVIAALRLRPEGGTLVVRGRTAGGPWEEHLDVPGTPPEEGAEAIPALWARETIEDLELDLACGGELKDIDRRIEEIALQHSVSSRVTSWVAIAEEPSVDPREPVRIERIPQALPYGMSAEGLGLSSPAGAMPFIASAIPLYSRVEESRVLVQRSRRDLELERTAETLRARLGDIRQIAMNEMERLRHFVREIEELTTLWQELVRFSVPANELAVRRRALLERLESLAHEMYGVRHLIEPLVTHVERFREMIIECKWPAPTETLPSRGRVFPTPGRPTATVEVLVTSGLDWRPARTAMLADRTVDIVEQGTTRPGPVVAGSLLRVELSAAPEAVARSRSVQIGSGDSVLIIALDEAD